MNDGAKLENILAALNRSLEALREVSESPADAAMASYAGSARAYVVEAISRVEQALMEYDAAKPLEAKTLEAKTLDAGEV
jgi:hypothetical protein